MKRAYITRAILKDYLTIKEVDVTFNKDINIIIGKNGVGKTNFINYLDDGLNKTPSLEISDIVIDFLVANDTVQKKILNSVYLDDEFTLKENNSIKYFTEGKEIDFKADSLLRQSKIGHGIPSKYHIARDPISDYIKKTDKGGYFLFPNHINSNLAFTIGVRYLLDVLVHERFLHDDFNFSNALEDLVVTLKKVSPIKDVKVGENFSASVINGEVHFNNLYLEYFVNGEWLLFDQLSDGTKRLFYIITEIELSKSSIILLEEPELGLHPHQLHKLMGFIKEKSEDFQFIITTHSPLVLNMLDKDQLDSIIIAKFEDKQTKLVHLTEEQKQKAQAYMEDLDLSDYWVHSDLED